MDDILAPVSLPDADRKLVCDFLVVFSRFESALKHRNYFREREENDGRFVIERGRFARDIQSQLATRLNSPEARRPIQYLLEHPPMEQVASGNTLTWERVPPHGPRRIDARFLMDAIYRVRNNLFHGGKWPHDPARDPHLLQATLAAIENFLECHSEVANAYFH